MIKKIKLLSDIFSYPDENLIKTLGLNCDLNETEAEYIRLFINNFDKERCSPYALDYFKNVNPSDFFINLKNLYKSAGVEISDDYQEREDHLVTLLEFLEFLIKIKTPEKYIKKFINNYLFWVIEFANKIEQSTNNELYLYGAKLLKETFNEYIKNY